MLDKIVLAEKRIVEKKTLHNGLVSQLNIKENEYSEFLDKSDISKQVSELLVKFSSEMREVVGKQIEQLVTAILNKAFPDRYEFKIEYKTRRGVVEADFLLKDISSNKMLDILDSNGGTIADMVSATLFFVLSEMIKPGDNFIIFDEIGKHISADKRESFFKFLKELIKTYKKQIIYVTHQNELIDIADKVIKFRLNENKRVEIE